MVLYFLYAVLALAAFLAAGLFVRSRVTLRAELSGDLLYIEADVRVLFRIARIRARAWLRVNDAKESLQIEIAGIKAINKTKDKRKKKRKQSKRRKKLDLIRLIPVGSLKSAMLRGRIQLFDDACANTLAAGALNALFRRLLLEQSECESISTAVTPTFDKIELWLYMEGIFDVSATQIIKAILKYKNEGRTARNGTSNRKHNEGDYGKPGFNG